MIIFMPEISPSRLGFTAFTDRRIIALSVRSYWLGYSAFMLGKSVSSGKDIFDRSSFKLGWQDSARKSSSNII